LHPFRGGHSRLDKGHAFEAIFKAGEGHSRIKQRAGARGADRMGNLGINIDKAFEITFRVAAWRVRDAGRLGGNTVSFAEYIRSLDEDIRTCVGVEGERIAAKALILQRRGARICGGSPVVPSTLDSFAWHGVR